MTEEHKDESKLDDSIKAELKKQGFVFDGEIYIKHEGDNIFFADYRDGKGAFLGIANFSCEGGEELEHVEERSDIKTLKLVEAAVGTKKLGDYL